jgi:hypothetical protein
MYRFRKIKSLIEYNEIKNQEIYFASVDQLNDPIEGYRETMWRGDRIQWECLFSHYLLCLENVYRSFIISGELIAINRDDILVFQNEDTLPTEEYRKRIHELQRNLCTDHRVIELTRTLSEIDEPISAKELEMYLRLIHFDMLKRIANNLKTHGLCSESHFPQSTSGTAMIDATLKFAKEAAALHKRSDTNAVYDKLAFSITSHINDQMELLHFLGLKDANPNKDFLIIEFPREYIRKIEELVYPNWFVSCFMSECTNSSVWGNYGDNHKGVCLKFRDEIVHDGIELINNDGRKEKIHFQKVTYSTERPKVNFFESLGRLPMPQILTQWMTDHDGNVSPQYGIFCNRIADFRAEYHNDFSKIVSTKTVDWHYENEYRLVIDNMFHDYSDSNARKFKYNFNDLEGIIFGMNTEKGQKIEIINAVKRKCEEEKRTTFSFYQAAYSNASGQIEIRKMDLIKFSNETPDERSMK